MKPFPKLVFFDLDGTLLNSSGVISDRVKEAIQKLKAGGTKIAFASGRPYFAASKLMKEVGVDAPSAFFSCSLIIDPISEKPLKKWSLQSDALSRIYDRLLREGLYCEAYTTEGYFVERWNERTDIHISYMHVDPTEEDLKSVIRTQEIIKFLFMAYEGEEQRKMRKIVEDFPLFQYGIASGASHPDILFCNITNPEASRERVFDWIIEHLGISSRDVMAFGDGESDMVFLGKAGVGVAMGNASSKVKSAASYVTVHVDEDGVAEALDRLVFTE